MDTYQVQESLPNLYGILVLRPDISYCWAMTTALSERVADRVRALIELRGLKKKALASALGITESQAYSRISGRVAFEVDELPAVSDFLGCDLQELLRSDAA